eukprot:6877351-Lingulodinium_polyedra.AAC.1
MLAASDIGLQVNGGWVKFQPKPDAARAHSHSSTPHLGGVPVNVNGGTRASVLGRTMALTSQ